MTKHELSNAVHGHVRPLLLTAIFMCVTTFFPALAVPQDVNPPAPGTPAVALGPEVTTIDPPRVAAGYDKDLSITGKNFVQGAKVSFANPGIRVMSVTFLSSTDLTLRIRVAVDAAPGVASLFVINPDDSEVEAPFEVTGKTKPSVPPSPELPVTTDSAGTQRFAAYHLGNPTEVFQVHGKVK